MDSLDLVEAVMLIEEVFGTEIPDGDACKLSKQSGGRFGAGKFRFTL